MNELFDKELNAQKESLKKPSRVHVSSRKKSAMKMKVERNKEKNDARVKMLLMEGSPL